MRKIPAVAVFLALVMIIAHRASALPNPAAVYCEESGFAYETIHGEGGDTSVCILPDGTCGAWEFYNGACGEEYGMSMSFSSYAVATEQPPITISAANEPEAISDSGHAAPVMAAYSAAPEAFDLRNAGGENWTTPVKDQGGCGSCWAFASVAAAESAFEVNLNNSMLNPSLSEQQIVSCSSTGNCDLGGEIEPTLDYMEENGIVNDTCFPYTAIDSACSMCPSYDLHRITGWHDVVPTLGSLKQSIIEKGPVIIGLELHSDFFGYTGGIYMNGTPTMSGAHAMAIVGYNDTGEYLIVKNSWGADWGESGYVKISYHYYPIYLLIGIDGTDWDSDGVDDRTDNCPYDYNPSQNDINGTGTPIWSLIDTYCTPIDIRTGVYEDSNVCSGTFESMQENTSYGTCDYCYENITTVYTEWSACANGTRHRNISHADGNFATCCNVTGLDADCGIMNGTLYHNGTETVPCYVGDSVIGNITGVYVLIGNSTYTNGTMDTVENVSLAGGNGTLVEFVFDFANGQLNLSGISIEMQDANGTVGFIVINGIDLAYQNATKTAYVDAVAGGTGVCIIDADGVAASMFTGACTGENETWVACPGTSGPYSCENANGTFRVSGLRHSGVMEQPYYCGDASCNGDETCSSCQQDCGECPPPPKPRKSGGSSGYVVARNPPCGEDWICGEWSECSNGASARECTDVSGCGTVEGKPAEVRECEDEPAAALEGVLDVSDRTEPQSTTRAAPAATQTGMFMSGTAWLMATVAAASGAAVLAVHASRGRRRTGTRRRA